VLAHVNTEDGPFALANGEVKTPVVLGTGMEHEPRNCWRNQPSRRETPNF
jgi:hypothetical protein